MDISPRDDQAPLSPPPVRVALLDEEGPLRGAVIALLEAEPTLEFVGGASDAQGGIRLISEERPDVALVEMRIDGGEGHRIARAALERSPDTRLVGFSSAADREAVIELFRAGVIGFVDKAAAPQELVDGIHAAFAGRAVISSEISGEIVVELAGRLEAEDVVKRDARSRLQRISEVLADPEAMNVVFQPIYEIASNTPVGFEALARFRDDPQRPPNEWFGEAASVGLGPDLETESIRQAISHMPSLPESTYLSVNVSPESLPSPGLLEVLEDSPLDHIVVELTEHSIIDDYPTLSSTLGSLRDRGLRLAVDDAGAGYASLRHIVRLEPDIIKLDGELTSGIQNDAKRRAMATALISFATETDEAVVAEGVETVEELNVLHTLGVPFAQGYLLGRPAPLPQLAETGS